MLIACNRKVYKVIHNWYNRSMRGNKGLTPSRRRAGQDVTVTANQWVSNPRQEAFLEAYHDPSSDTFGNVYRSAIKVGYSESYARQLTSPAVKNMWIHEYASKRDYTENHIKAGIPNIAQSAIRDSDKLKALELLAKLNGLLIDKKVTAHINIEEALRNLK